MQHPPLIGLVKLFPTGLSWALYDLLSWAKDGWDLWMDGQTTVTHYPIYFDHILYNTVLQASSSLSPRCFSLLFVFPHKPLHSSSESSLVLEPSYLFCSLALKHTGLWDQPVTVYIDSRPRERIGKTDKRRWERGGTKPSPPQSMVASSVTQNGWVSMNFLYWKEGCVFRKSQSFVGF